MKCTQIISVQRIFTVEHGVVCNGEMEEKGVVVKDVEPDGPLSLNLRKGMLYQCKNCKDIQII